MQINFGAAFNGVKSSAAANTQAAQTNTAASPLFGNSTPKFAGELNADTVQFGLRVPKLQLRSSGNSN